MVYANSSGGGGNQTSPCGSNVNYTSVSAYAPYMVMENQSFMTSMYVNCEILNATMLRSTIGSTIRATPLYSLETNHGLERTAAAQTSPRMYQDLQQDTTLSMQTSMSTEPSLTVILIRSWFMPTAVVAVVTKPRHVEATSTTPLCLHTHPTW
jgi:hypothetical protein